MTGLDRQIFAIVVIIGAAMAALSYWVSAYVRHMEIQSTAETSALYMDVLFKPLLSGVTGEGVVSSDVEAEFDGLLAEGLSDDFIEKAKLWWRDGTIAYSTDKSMMGLQIPSPQLEAAFDGEIVAAFLEDLSDHGDHAQENLGKPLLEVYTPLRHPVTGAITAVGEFYHNAEQLQMRLSRVTYTIWGIVGPITVLMLTLLLVTAARARTIAETQRNDLKRRLEETQQLAHQNEALRRIAENAKLDAFKINEDFLNQIGSDLHDGPLQLLGLIMLRMKGIHARDAREPGAGTERDDKILDLVAQTMQDLRNLAFGLAIPELEPLNVRETLLLAVSRHESQTGTDVVTDFGDLPEEVALPLKICLYRIVQEALNNAFRHAGGAGQHVRAFVEAGHIEIIVTDHGPGLMQDAETPEGGRLGLSGIAKRAQTLGGTLSVRSREGRGTSVAAKLPIKRVEAQWR